MSRSPAPDTPKPAPPTGTGAVKHPAPPSPWGGEGQRSLLRPSTMVMLFLAMGFVLVMLFPGENYNDPRYNARADGVSVAYLRAIVKVRPNDPGPRLALVRQLLSLSLLKEAMKYLQPLLTPERVTMLEADLLALDVEERRFYAVRAGDIEAREDALDALIARRERLLASRISAPALERLARLSLSLDQPGQAARIYLRLASFVRGRRDDYLELAGTWYLSAGEHALAAQALREAALARRDFPGRAVALANRAVDALVAGNRTRDALKLLEEMRTKLGGGRALITRGLKLALSISDLELALHYAQLLAAIAPEDVFTQRQMRDLALARGRNDDAMRAAEALVRLRPRDHGERRRLAEIAGWSGDLIASLESWTWLARRGDLAALDRSLALARPLLDWDKIVELFSLKAELRGLTYEELLELTRAYESLADPLEAALAVHRWGNPGERRTWELLARLYDGAAEDEKEIEVWDEVGRRFGRRIGDVMRQAELAYRLGKPDLVWKIIKDARPLARPEDLDYWRSLAEQAWIRDEQADALAALRMLWAARKMESSEVGRLLQILGRIGQRRELMVVARQAWIDTGNPNFLLMGMQTAADAHLYPELEGLTDLAEQRLAVFKDIEHFWLLRAGLMSWKDRYAEVETCYRTALELNPMSREARMGWLAFALEHDRRERLAQLLTAWWEMALTDPAYARVFAAGLDRLGRLDEALPFYEIEARTRPRDLGWLESYADALSRAGRADGALRLREQVLRGRRQAVEPVLEAWASTPAKERGAFSIDSEGVSHGMVSAEPVVAYARLLRHLRGNRAAARVTRALVRRASHDADVQALALDIELARDNTAAARRWLWRRKDEGELPRPPLSVRLAMALAENDHETLAALLAYEGKNLPIGDQVTVLRTLGLQAAARRVVADGLMGERPRDEKLALQDHARELGRADDDRVRARLLVEAVGALDVLQQEASYEGPGPWTGGRVGLSASHLRLLPASGALLLGSAESRGQVEVVAIHDDKLLMAELRLGVEALPGGPALLAEIEGGMRLPELGPGSLVSLGFSHGGTQEGAIMRAFGRRDRLAAAFDLGLTRREQVRAIFDLRRDTTIDGEWLARGGGLLVDASHLLLSGSPSLRAYLQAAASANQRAAEVPAALAMRLAPGVTMDAILPGRYAAFSTGISLGTGDLGLVPMPVSVFSWGLDLSAGWLLPAGQLALRGDGVLHWRFLPGHDLGGRLFLSRSQSGRAGETERGLELRYVIAWY